MVKTKKTVKTVKGSVRPRPNAENVSYYDLTLELGKDPVTGKRKRLYFKSDTTDRQEAENQLMIKKVEYLQEEIVEPSKETVEQYLLRYLENVRRNLSPATTRDYKGVIERYLIPEFGNIKLQGLTRPKVQQVYNDWKVKSNKSENPLKATTIKHINRVFKTALNSAVEDGLIKENPTIRIKIGKDIEPNHLDVYTVEEIKELQKKVKGTDMELPVALLFDCVLRRGELLGLRYSDINFEKKEVTVQYTWAETEGNQPVLKTCKTESSYRKMIVSDYTINLLKRQKSIYLRNKMKYGKDFCNSNRVICKENGEPFLPKSFTRKWARTLEKHGLRHIKLHGTRHSAISLLLSEGVPIHLVQQRAGHQDPKITLSVYSHVAKDTESVVAEKFNNVLFSAVNQ